MSMLISSPRILGGIVACVGFTVTMATYNLIYLVHLFSTVAKLFNRSLNEPDDLKETSGRKSEKKCISVSYLFLPSFGKVNL